MTNWCRTEWMRLARRLSVNMGGSSGSHSAGEDAGLARYVITTIKTLEHAEQALYLRCLDCNCWPRRRLQCARRDRAEGGIRSWVRVSTWDPSRHHRLAAENSMRINHDSTRLQRALPRCFRIEYRKGEGLNSQARENPGHHATTTCDSAVSCKSLEPQGATAQGGLVEVMICPVLHWE